jgi:hypothetical protein
MERERKYGYCKMTSQWVPRDEMTGVTIKVYAHDGSEQRVPIRLSKEALPKFMDYIKNLAWDGNLISAEEMREKSASTLGE